MLYQRLICKKLYSLCRWLSSEMLDPIKASLFEQNQHQQRKLISRLSNYENKKLNILIILPENKRCCDFNENEICLDSFPRSFTLFAGKQ